MKKCIALLTILALPLSYTQHGGAFTMNLLFLCAAALAGTGAVYRGQLGAAPDTNDISSSLQLNTILESALFAFKRVVLPLRMFSTVFNAVPVAGTDKIAVPYYPLQGVVSKDFSGAYDFSTGAGSKTDVREIGGAGNWKRKYQPLKMTSTEILRQPKLSAEKLGEMKGNRLAFDVVTDILGLVTAANYPGVAYTGTDMDGDDVIDIKTACGKNTTGAASVADGVTTNGSAAITSATAGFTFSDIGSAIAGTGIPGGATIAGVTSATAATLSANATASGTGVTFTLTRPVIPWPEMGRGLLVNPDYDGLLLKDDTFRRDLTIAGASTVNTGKLPQIYGFDYGSSAGIPTNGENLVGMAVYSSAMLVAFSPIQPQDEGRIVDYKVVTDKETDLTVEYRRWFDPGTDTMLSVIEANYARAVGEALALKRIKSA